jgi:2'-5' RNA ligase
MIKPMDTIPCDIVLLPEEKLAERAMTASQQLEPFDTFFTLKTGEYYPHASLYMCQLAVDDLPKVEQVLQQIAETLQPFELSAVRYSLGQGFAVGYVDPEYTVTNELRTAQEAIIAAINPLRAGMRESDIAKMKDATGIKLENLQKYGFPSVGELFRPHMTLTRLKENQPEALAILPDIATFSGRFTRLGLFQMGSNGTCIREIFTCNL